MNREHLNLFLDGYLSLGSASPRDRRTLIEEASEAANHLALLKEWILIQSLGKEYLLQLRLWFCLSYEELAFVFNSSPREVGQGLRNIRTARLPVYSVSAEESKDLGGLSCFMVEQQLSSWLDNEVSDILGLSSLQIHLRGCENCQKRLQAYRNLQSQIMKERKVFEIISKDEWRAVLYDMRRRGQRQLWRISLSIFVFISVCLFLAWVIWSKPEKMPNVYESP